jgi:heptosyltransferase-2
MNILVIRYRFIGDTILTVPFLRNLRYANPDGNIDLVVAPYSSDVLQGIPYVDNLIVYDPPTIHADSRGEHRSLSSKIAFIKSLRSNNYDKAYVLKRSLSSAIIARLSGALERIGFDTERRGFLLSSKVPYRHDQHEVENFLDILRADGVKIVDDYLEAWISPPEEEFANSFFTGGGISEDDVVLGLHPFTAVRERSWHEDNFIEVSRRLGESHGVKTLIFGGPGDVSQLGPFIKGIHPPPLIAAGKTDLRQSMALIKKCSLLICNDSGVMHLGAALGTPLIALFGPQSPVKFGPWGINSKVVYKEFPCSPCRQRFFEECEPSEREKPMCMESITPEEIASMAKEFFEKV